MSVIVLKLTKEQEQLLFNGTMVNTGTGRRYYFLPYWFEQLEEGEYSMHNLGLPLPEDLQEEIKKIRWDIKTKEER